MAEASPQHDDTLNQLIRLAGDDWENDTSFAPGQRSYDWQPQSFPVDGQPIRLPLSNVTSVTSFKVDIKDQPNQNVTGYTLEHSTGWAYLVLDSTNARWPEVDTDKPNPIRIDFVAGPASQAAVPDDCQRSCLNVIQRWFEDGGLADKGDDAMGPAWWAHARRRKATYIP